jgi:hypothetical protein
VDRAVATIEPDAIDVAAPLEIGEQREDGGAES